MRTNQPPRGGPPGDICGLYFTVQSTEHSWQITRHYLPQVKLVSHTTITPVCHTTTLSQTYSNPSKETVPQARYTFPLYDGVAVSGYTITYGDKTLKGIVKHREVAKRTYEEAVDRGETAGLLESLPAGVFGVTLGNLPAQTDVHVSIVYCGELTHDAAIDGLRYMLPTSIAPRYGDYPGKLLQSTATNDGGISITVDVDMDTSAIRKVQSPSHPIAVSMGATSTTSNSQDAFHSSKASTTLTLGTTELGGDFILQLLIDDISAPHAIVESHSTLSNSQVIMATFVPRFSLKTAHPEIVFIADQSGSMRGSSNTSLAAALKIFLKSLPFGVHFNIYAFGSAFKPLWPKSQSYNESNLAAAIDFVNTFEAQYGGTEILEPVKAAFEQRLGGDVALEVMLLTDGEIWGEDALFEYVGSQLGENGVDARVFALGIGANVSHTLVEGVARAGNGFAQFVTKDEETDKKVVRMLKGALYPHLTQQTMEVKYSSGAVEKEVAMVDEDEDDFELIEKVDYSLDIDDPSAKDTAQQSTQTNPTSLFDPSADLDSPIKPKNVDRYAHLPTLNPPTILQAPSKLPSLFPFNRTTIYLMLDSDNTHKRVTSITLRATSPQGPLELTIPVNPTPTQGTTVHQLAARKAIQDLEEGRGWLQTATTTSSDSPTLVKTAHARYFDELVEREAVRLGERYQVAGKWTSFVAVADKDGGSAEDQEVQVREAASSRSIGGPPRMQKMMMSMSSAAPVTRSARRMPMTLGMSAPETKSKSLSVKKKKKMTTKSAFVAPAEEAEMDESGDDDALQRVLGEDSEGSDEYDGQARFAREADSDSDEDGDGDDGEAQRESVDQTATTANTTTATAIPSTPKSTLHHLISLQKFSGAWDWSEELFEAVGVDELKAQVDATFSQEVMATALAVAFLETKLAASKEVWEMVVAKARAWMGMQVGTAEAVEGVVSKARGLL